MALTYYKDFTGFLMTDDLEQYHKLERDLEGGGDKRELHGTYKAREWIGAIYDLEGALKDLAPKERLKERQASIKPLVEEFFAWIRETLANQKVLPK